MVKYTPAFAGAARNLIFDNTIAQKIMFRNILLCTLLALPAAGICQKAKKVKKQVVATTVKTPAIDYKAIGSPMPPIRLITHERKVITDAMVSDDANLVVMMFNPTCGHCEEMTRAIEENIALFKKTPIVLLAAASMFEYLDYFRKNLKAVDYPALKIGVDSSQFIDKAFNYNGLPQVNIYDHNRKLIKTYSTITTIDSIRTYIE